MSLIKRLVIAGAGNFGREVWQWAKDIPADNKEWEEVVFINDEKEIASQRIKQSNINSEIISTIDDYIPLRNDVCICAIADPKGKLNVVNRLKEKNVKFINIVHPTAIIGSGVVLGVGVILCPNTVITVNVTIGDFVIINLNSVVGHDACIEDGVTISAQCDITGYVSLKEGCFLGSGARILPKATVGEFATVGAGSVVLKKVFPYRTVFGNPAYYIDS